jgi:cobalt/nickel transport protein
MDKIYLLGFVAILIIFSIPFMINPNAGYGGTDNKGSDLILKNSPDYKPWFKPLWEPPSETSSMLFALQAAIGGLIIGYFIGQNKVEKR